MAVLRESRPGEAGFTLVELLVAMTISMVVLLATLQSFDLFSSSAAQQTRITDANDQVRRTMDRVVLDLRGASVIKRAEPKDLVYTVPETSGVRFERLCVTSDDLYASSTSTEPGTACTGNKLAELKSTKTAFTYDKDVASPPDTPQLVKNVGLTFSLDVAGGGVSSTLRASAARRSANTLPLTDTDVDAECDVDGSGALLSLSAGVPDRDLLSLTYHHDGGVIVGTPLGTTEIPEGITSVVATITDAAGVTTTIVRDIECETP